MPIYYADGSAAPPEAARPLGRALRRGFRKACPQCGRGHIFQGYSTVQDLCEICGLELFHQRADDAPPYFTLLILGHILVPALLLVEQLFAPPQWLQLSIFLPLTVVLTLWLLPKVKGALIAFQWSRRMHGFGGVED